MGMDKDIKYPYSLEQFQKDAVNNGFGFLLCDLRKITGSSLKTNMIINNQEDSNGFFFNDLFFRIASHSLAKRELIGNLFIKKGYRTERLDYIYWADHYEDDKLFGKQDVNDYRYIWYTNTWNYTKEEHYICYTYSNGNTEKIQQPDGWINLLSYQWIKKANYHNKINKDESFITNSMQLLGSAYSSVDIYADENKNDFLFSITNNLGNLLKIRYADVKNYNSTFNTDKISYFFLDIDDSIFNDPYWGTKNKE